MLLNVNRPMAGYLDCIFSCKRVGSDEKRNDYALTGISVNTHYRSHVNNAPTLLTHHDRSACVDKVKGRLQVHSINGDFLCAVKNETDATSVFDKILSDYKIDDPNAAKQKRRLYNCSEPSEKKSEKPYWQYWG